MPTRDESPGPEAHIPFDDACALVDSALSGAARRSIVADALRSRDLGDALVRLRERPRGSRCIHVVEAPYHATPVAAHSCDLDP